MDLKLGSRLEMSSVRKTLLSQYSISLHMAVFHPVSHSAECSVSFSALFYLQRVTQPEPRRQKSHGNPLQTCSQRLTQMAVLSTWQASWDPLDPHGAVGLNPVSRRQQTQPNMQCVCVLLTNLFI